MAKHYDTQERSGNKSFFIQRDQKVSVQPNRQDQGDTRLTLKPSVIPNSNYVVTIGDWNCLKHYSFACFFVL
jgi:hypothetical protein